MNNFDTLIAYLNELRTQTLVELEKELKDLRLSYRNYSNSKYRSIWRKMRSLKKQINKDVASVGKLLEALSLEIELNKNFNKYKRKKW